MKSMRLLHTCVERVHCIECSNSVCNVRTNFLCIAFFVTWQTIYTFLCNNNIREIIYWHSILFYRHIISVTKIQRVIKWRIYSSFRLKMKFRFMSYQIVATRESVLFVARPHVSKELYTLFRLHLHIIVKNTVFSFFLKLKLSVKKVISQIKLVLLLWIAFFCAKGFWNFFSTMCIKIETEV